MQVDATISDEIDFWGKKASDLQANIRVFDNNAIVGNLKYVEDYSEGGFDMSLGHHFIAIHAAATKPVDSITVEVVGGLSGPITLESDGLIVLQLVSTAKAIKVVATKGTKSETKVYKIGSLIKEAQ